MSSDQIKMSDYVPIGISHFIVTYQVSIPSPFVDQSDEVYVCFKTKVKETSPEQVAGMMTSDNLYQNQHYLLFTIMHPYAKYENHFFFLRIDIVLTWCFVLTSGDLT